MDAQTKAMPLLLLLHGLSNFHGKKYCYPSQKKIVDLLISRQDIKISIATLNRRLRSAEDAGYLRRIRRLRRDPRKGMVFQSTVYLIKQLGYLLLSRVGIPCWEALRKIAASRFKKAPKSLKPHKAQQEKAKGVAFKNFKNRHPDLKMPVN